jgi:hypothetical protein
LAADADVREHLRLGVTLNETSLRWHWDAALSGKPLRMLPATQALRRCRQYPITEVLIAHDMRRELFTSGLGASRFVPVVRFR